MSTRVDSVQFWNSTAGFECSKTMQSLGHPRLNLDWISRSRPSWVSLSSQKPATAHLINAGQRYRTNPSLAACERLLAMAINRYSVEGQESNQTNTTSETLRQTVDYKANFARVGNDWRSETPKTAIRSS